MAYRTNGDDIVIMNPCEIKTPQEMASRTIQTNLMETTENLDQIESTVNAIIKFIWFKEEIDDKEIEKVDLDSHIVSNLDCTRRIREKINMIASRLGC